MGWEGCGIKPQNTGPQIDPKGPEGESTDSYKMGIVGCETMQNARTGVLYSNLFHALCS